MSGNSGNSGNFFAGPSRKKEISSGLYVTSSTSAGVPKQNKEGGPHRMPSFLRVVSYAAFACEGAAASIALR